MTVTLTVSGVAPQEAGRGVALIPASVRTELGVAVGDVVEISGRRSTVARVLPAYPNDRPDVIRVDGSVRANAGVAIDEEVAVSPTSATPAEQVVVAPSGDVYVRGATEYVQRSLRGRPFVRGDVVRVNLLGGPFTFVVTATRPTGAVVVTDETTVTVEDRPVSPRDIERMKTTVPEVTYEDIGGLTDELELVRETVELPLRHPELFARLGIEPPRGILLFGPPGTGKTLIAKAVANEVDAHFVNVSGPEFVSKYYGESESKLRDVFEEAADNAPAIVHIDELDSIAPNRDAVTGEVERRIVAQLLSLMDGLEARGEVVVVGSTNRPDAIDPALRRGGRFDREIEIGVPDRDGRHEILQIHTRGMPLADDVDLGDLADHTHGFVGADLATLAREAALAELRRIRPDVDLEAEEIPADVLDEIQVDGDDFAEAMRQVTPSAMRELTVDLPDVTFDDVGGLDPVKTELTKAVEWPMKYPDLFERFATEPPKGVLLYGPPGTGKTLLAKAVANASDANFISVKGPELLDKYVGESEKAVRDLFAKARANAPTVVFLDEVDAIAPERGTGGDTRVMERVVSQLLTELDGVEETSGIVVVGATNRPDMIDAALLRSGRLEKLIHVPVPDRAAREAIFAIHTREVPLADDVSIGYLADRTEGYTGSDVEAICREAATDAMADAIDAYAHAPGELGDHLDEFVVGSIHFERALEVVRPSVSEDVRERYEALVARLGGNVPATEEVAIGFQ